ncbi:MAG: hypothetical protein KTR33_08175 [Gammaproteobacteria bacterium]|nr:hypothetical protein [Gammaproteobacteria bacterium]
MMLVVTLYLLIGFLFGCAFAIRGYAALEPSAKGAPIRFRLLLIPANLLLWPYLLFRWMTS